MACGPARTDVAYVPSPAETAYAQLTSDILQDYYRRNPPAATDLGIHLYDSRLEDVSSAAVEDELTSTRAFLTRLEGINERWLPPDRQIDREWLMHVAEDRRCDFHRALPLIRLVDRRV
mgnify:CR=1 FL=1